MSKFRDKNSPKILIVDDNLICRSITARCFEELGYKTKQAENGLAALSSFDISFDLVVTDIEMPEMSGHQLALEIHKMSKSIPIIAMTSLSRPIREGNKWDEFSEIMDKPITKEKCRKIVEAAKTDNANEYYKARLLRAV